MHTTAGTHAHAIVLSLASHRNGVVRPRLHIARDDEYLCPAGERLRRHQTRLEDGLNISVYWTYICPQCPLKTQCTTGNERRVRRWEHEAVLDAMQRRLDRRPDAMKVRRRTIEQSNMSSER